MPPKLADEDSFIPPIRKIPDFLWDLMALTTFVRLSLLKAAYVAVVDFARQEIRDRAEGWGTPDRGYVRVFLIETVCGISINGLTGSLYMRRT